jgi:hypothetical protein
MSDSGRRQAVQAFRLHALARSGAASVESEAGAAEEVHFPLAE